MAERDENVRLGNLRRGNPGNRGGGRHKESLKEECSEVFSRLGLPMLKRIAANKPVKTASGREKLPYSVADQLKAITLLGKYAGLEQTTVDMKLTTVPLDEDVEAQIAQVYKDDPES